MLRFPEHARVAAPDLSQSGTAREQPRGSTQGIRAIVHLAAATPAPVAATPGYRAPAARGSPRLLTFANRVPAPGSPEQQAATVVVRARVFPKAHEPAPSTPAFEPAPPRPCAPPRSLGFPEALTRGAPEL